jgi:hypothetical protein
MSPRSKSRTEREPPSYPACRAALALGARVGGAPRGGGGQGGKGGAPMCKEVGQQCGAPAECCSMQCMGGYCAPGGGGCTMDGGPCLTDSQCCSMNCVNGKCGAAPMCKEAGQQCQMGDECCSKQCFGGRGQQCFLRFQCCSMKCTNNVCQPRAPRPSCRRLAGPHGAPPCVTDPRAIARPAEPGRAGQPGGAMYARRDAPDSHAKRVFPSPAGP